MLLLKPSHCHSVCYSVQSKLIYTDNDQSGVKKKCMCVNVLATSTNKQNQQCDTVNQFPTNNKAYFKTLNHFNSLISQHVSQRCQLFLIKKNSLYWQKKWMSPHPLITVIWFSSYWMRKYWGKAGLVVASHSPASAFFLSPGVCTPSSFLLVCPLRPPAGPLMWWWVSWQCLCVV